VGVGGTQSLAVETAFLLLPALVCVLVLSGSGRGTFGTEGAGHALLLIGGGIATAVPLMLFGAAAVRIPLTTIGLLQYLAPIMHFGIGVGINGEEMPWSRWVGFALVWTAVAVFTYDSLRARRAIRSGPGLSSTDGRGTAGTERVRDGGRDRGLVRGQRP
jgi:chloramphenicol-sensitive protein RarD